jgi:hypothetical protein
MRSFVLALAGALVLAACDPTDKNHYSCTRSFEGVSDACIQLYLTEPEGNVADRQCEDNGGAWEYRRCRPEGRVAGHCRVDDAAEYSFSGTPAEVYFYDPVTPTAAEEACGAAGGAWVD